jgi:hypothetical protein
MTQDWTKEECKKLHALGIDPMRSDRAKLLALRKYFEGDRRIYAVTEGKILEVRVSGDFARKVRDLVRDGKLDWLQESAQTTISPPNTAHLCLRSPCGQVFTDGIREARYATIEVANDSEVEATGCWAWADIQTKGLKVPLHWAGTEITPMETDAPRISINKRKPARLDIAFAIAALGKTRPVNHPTTVSGDVVIYPREPQKTAWDGKGCWLAQPAVLYNPDPGWEAYLPPGDHRVKVTVGCLKGQGDITADYIIISPSSWEGLDIKQA